MAVDETSPAFEAGLRPADLITHVNGEPVQGLFHTQVLQLLLNNSNNEHVTLRATPLEYTSIQSGGRKRDVHHSKLAKKSVSRQKKQRKDAEKKRKTSLFRRISTKRASAEIQQQMAANLPSPGAVTPSRSCQSFTIQQSNIPSVSNARDDTSTRGSNTPPLRLSLSPLDSYLPQSSSQSSSPSSSAPNTPTSVSNNNNLILGGSSGGNHNNSSHLYHHHHQRPSTLHGLKHKLHSSVVANKGLHHTSGGGVPNGGVSINTNSSRRKSIGHLISPLARTPSPSALPASPTRSPSPLAFPVIVPGHQPGASNTTQSYSPGGVLPSSAGLSNTLCNSVCVSNCNSSNLPIGTSTASAGKKTSFARPKSAEPSSPLLRRALSPDRLHPRSASENKCSISPLCCTANPIQNNNAINMHAATAVVGVKKQRNGNTGNLMRQNVGPKTMLTNIDNFPNKLSPNNQSDENICSNEKNKQLNDSYAATFHEEHSEIPAQSSLSIKGNQLQQQSQSSLTLSLQNQSELLPIAEEKDSPVSGNCPSMISEIESKEKTGSINSSEIKVNTKNAENVAVKNSSQDVNTNNNGANNARKKNN